MKTLLSLSALLAVLASGCDSADRAQAAEPVPAPVESTVAPAPPVPEIKPQAPPIDGGAAAVTAPTPPPELPGSVQDIVRLAQTTVGEQVLIDFVATIDKPYSLNVEQVIYLKDLGIPDTVIGALLKRQLALGGAEVALPEDPILADSSATDTPANPKLALTNAPGTNLGVVTTAPAPAQSPVPNAPTMGETTEPANPPPVAAPAPATTVNYNVFYNSLSPYGTWVEIGDYGWCWQPTVTTINVGWRPYSDHGRWVWSSSGWYWHSYYSWGWAPFHYGRWCNVPARGWCWVPGSVWGPSWVSWRQCDDHFGWAPLPPACGWAAGVGLTYHGSGVSVGFSFGLAASDYCFVPRHRFYDPHCYRFRAHHHELTGLYHRSQVVNNYTVNNNTVIINHGVGREMVQKHTRGEIRPIALADARQPGRTQDLGLRSGRPGNRLEVYRPTVAANTSATRPPATVLTRQETRPGSVANRTQGGGLTGARPAPNSSGRGENSALATTRSEARPQASGEVNRGFSSRPGPLGRREPTAVISPRGGQLPARTAVPTAQTGSTAAELHGRGETRATPSTGGAPANTGVRAETRPSAVTSGPASPPSMVRPSHAAPVSGRTEARPIPQQQLSVRRETPAIQVQPAPANASSLARPDTTRLTPTPFNRPQPSYTPAPIRTQPQAQPQPRLEARPQYQAPVTRSVPQATLPTRSVGQPVGANPGGGAARPTGQRNQPQ